MTANGHVQDNIHAIDTGAECRQSLQLFRNGGVVPITFSDVTPEAGTGFAKLLVGRGLAIGDYDNDGKMDITVVDSEGGPLLLHNVCTTAGHWLEVRLVGRQSNRDGIGATLTATLGSRRLLRLCHTDGSYLSASDKRVHFGLGTANQVDRLDVKWPSGRTSTLLNVPADKQILVDEGKAQMPTGGRAR